MRRLLRRLGLTAVEAPAPSPPPTAPKAPLLAVRVDGVEVAVVRAADIPVDVTPDVAVAGPATVDFVEASGRRRVHVVPGSGRWLHLSLRVHPSLACQADAVRNQAPTHVPGGAIGDDDVGIRFQPFFLSEAPAAPDLNGRGLFARGLHYGGTVMPGHILLSCECDGCARTFVARSFHAGFAGLAYFYSGSGRHTLTVDSGIEGAPAPLSTPDPALLAALEARLPQAPDRTRFGYLNPFRCPHCAAPFIDFAAHPEMRPGEYYALHLPDVPPIHLTGG